MCKYSLVHWTLNMHWIFHFFRFHIRLVDSGKGFWFHAVPGGWREVPKGFLGEHYYNACLAFNYFLLLYYSTPNTMHIGYCILHTSLHVYGLFWFDCILMETKNNLKYDAHKLNNNNSHMGITNSTNYLHVACGFILVCVSLSLPIPAFYEYAHFCRLFFRSSRHAQLNGERFGELNVERFHA